MGSSGGGVAYLAHIGGFIAGIGSGFIWKHLSASNMLGTRLRLQ